MNEGPNNEGDAVEEKATALMEAWLERVKPVGITSWAGLQVFHAVAADEREGEAKGVGRADLEEVLALNATKAGAAVKQLLAAGLVSEDAGKVLRLTDEGRKQAGWIHGTEAKPEI